MPNFSHRASVRRRLALGLNRRVEQSRTEVSQAKTSQGGTHVGARPSCRGATLRDDARTAGRLTEACAL